MGLVLCQHSDAVSQPPCADICRLLLYLPLLLNFGQAVIVVLVLVFGADKVGYLLAWNDRRETTAVLY